MSMQILQKLSTSHAQKILKIFIQEQATLSNVPNVQSFGQVSSKVKSCCLLTKANTQLCLMF